VTESVVIGIKLDIIYRDERYMHAELPNGTDIPACITVEGIEYRLHLAGQVYNNRVTTCWYAVDAQ